MPSGFVLRPKVDYSASDDWTHTIKSDPTKEYWEHIFGSDDDIYLYSANNKHSIGTKCKVSENDVPSISSADGKITSIKGYARGKVVGSGTFQLTISVGNYGVPTDITEGDGYVTAEYDCVEYDNLEDDLWELPIGGYVGNPLINGVKTFDYVYCEVNYTPAAPTIHSQTIVALDEGELASLRSRPDKCTWVNEWGFEVRLKETEELVKKVTWTGKLLEMVVFSTELGLDDNLEYGTTYEGRAYCVTTDGTGYGPWVEFTTRIGAEITTQAATEIIWQAAMGNGTIVTGEPTERGFEIRLDFGEYKDSNSGTLSNYIDHRIAGFTGDVTWDIVYKWNGILTKTESETGTYSTGAYELVLGYPSVLGNPSYIFSDKLFKCESYTYRAYMVIGEDIYHGEYVAFDTLCADAPIADDISDGNPVEPIIPIEPIEPIEIIEEEFPEFIWELPEWEFPPWIFPDLPDWEFPDYPPMDWTGDFYYRRPYTKKDLDDLRRKCIIYSKNSIEFALVLRHNMNVLREFFNMMTDYMDKEEFNDFTDLIPPQRLKELYLDPLGLNDFRNMINGFIRNTIDNNIAVNRNFNLIQDGLSDYETESDDAYFKEINSNIKTVTEDNPDVHRLKRKIDSLNQEVSFNFGSIMRNLKILRARLL